MDNWRKELETENKRHIIQLLGECRTTKEVDNVVNEHIDFIEKHSDLLKFARQARIRINRVRREARKSWKTYELN